MDVRVQWTRPEPRMVQPESVWLAYLKTAVTEFTSPCVNGAEVAIRETQTP